MVCGAVSGLAGGGGGGSEGHSLSTMIMEHNTGIPFFLLLHYFQFFISRSKYFKCKNKLSLGIASPCHIPMSK